MFAGVLNDDLDVFERCFRSSVNEIRDVLFVVGHDTVLITKNDRTRYRNLTMDINFLVAEACYGQA